MKPISAHKFADPICAIRIETEIAITESATATADIHGEPESLLFTYRR